MAGISWTRARSRLPKVFARRLEALRLNLPGALDGDVDNLHDARVASRRLREAVPLLGSPGLYDEAVWLGRRLRKVTRALGGVRELDVVGDELARIEAARPDLRGAVIRVREDVLDERAVRRRDMLRALARVDTGQLADRLHAAVEAAALVPGHEGWGRVLSFRLARRASRLAAAIEAAGALYAPDTLHAVRIRAKQLRYALELAREIGGLRTEAAVGRLKALQELLGHAHDLEVLLGWCRPAGSGDDLLALDREMAPLRAALADRIRRLHAEYLKQRHTVEDVTAHCRERFCPPLVAPPGQARSDIEETDEDARHDSTLPGAARHRRRTRRPVPGRRAAPAHREGHRALPGGRRRPDEA